MNNSTAYQIVEPILGQPIPLWIRILALVGAYFILIELARIGFGILTGITYLISFIKFLINKLKGD